MSDVGRSVLLRPRTLLSVFGLLFAVGACAFGVLAWRGSQAAPARSFGLAYPRYDTLIATVNATGQMEPAQVVNLNFGGAGRVNEVLVSVGAQVAKGDPLARLDTRELELRVTQAEAALAQAQASYEKLRAGATKEEVAAAEAQLQQASGQLRQSQGSVTGADLRAAEAQLQQARAALASLTAGPKTPDLRAAEAQLQQAQANLQAQRDQLSAAKTNAQLQLDQAVNSLTQSQSRYSAAKWNWDYVQETGNDPIAPEVPDSSRPGQSRPNQLNDAQRQQYNDAFVQAEAALHTAESNVRQAEVAYDNARQAEVTGLRAAEQQVVTAQSNLDKLLAGADDDQLAAARAQVAAAQANLDKLRGEQRRGALDAAEAGVAQAQANLDRVRAGAQPGDLTVAQAQMQSAQAALDLAQLTLDEATLTAPFAGTVAEINLKVGEVPSPADVPVVLADLSGFHVDVTVDEIDVSRLEAGQPVTLTLDALPELALPGQVETISPLATANATVTSYQVRVVTAASDPRVRPGMSTNADIVVASKPNVLVVPRRAVRNDRGRLLVDVPTDQSICALPVDQRPPTPPLTQREVQTGLSNDQVIEIISGLDERTCIYIEGLDARLNPFGGPPPGVRR